MRAMTDFSALVNTQFSTISDDAEIFDGSNPISSIGVRFQHRSAKMAHLLACNDAQSPTDTIRLTQSDSPMLSRRRLMATLSSDMCNQRNV